MPLFHAVLAAESEAHCSIRAGILRKKEERKQGRKH